MGFAWGGEGGSGSAEGLCWEYSCANVKIFMTINTLITHERIINGNGKEWGQRVGPRLVSLAV